MFVVVVVVVVVLIVLSGVTMYISPNVPDSLVHGTLYVAPLLGCRPCHLGPVASGRCVVFILMGPCSGYSMCDTMLCLFSFTDYETK